MIRIHKNSDRQQLLATVSSETQTQFSTTAPPFLTLQILNEPPVRSWAGSGSGFHCPTAHDSFQVSLSSLAACMMRQTDKSVKCLQKSSNDILESDHVTSFRIVWRGIEAKGECTTTCWDMQAVFFRSLFGHRPKCSWNDRNKFSDFGQKDWNYRL